jgi:hypothetical protein
MSSAPATVSFNHAGPGEPYQTLTHDEFYVEFVRRNAGLISPEEQRQLRAVEVLVAGCGSVGGAVVEPLVRLGTEHLTLAEPGCYELANLNRQRAWVCDLGRNKALVQAERVREINPFLKAKVVGDGVTDDNVEELVQRADLIVDGIDVTTHEAIRHKLALHAHAAVARIPVICGYDIAGVQAVLVFDYRKEGLTALGGKLPVSGTAEPPGPMAFLARIVPRSAIPVEMVPELRRLVSGRGDGFPQLVYAADLFGVLASRAIVDLLAGREVRSPAIVDVHQVLRPRLRRWLASAARILGLLRLVPTIVRARRNRLDGGAGG